MVWVLCGGCCSGGGRAGLLCGSWLLLAFFGLGSPRALAYVFLLLFCYCVHCWWLTWGFGPV